MLIKHWRTDTLVIQRVTSRHLVSSPTASRPTRLGHGTAPAFLRSSVEASATARLVSIEPWWRSELLRSELAAGVFYELALRAQ